MRVIVDNNYTYETDLALSVGDRVVLPTPYWLREFKGNEWVGSVTSTTSSYSGECVRIIRKEN